MLVPPHPTTTPLPPFLLPRNALCFCCPLMALRIKAPREESTQNSGEAGAGRASESLTTSGRSWGLTEYPHPYQPLTSASNKIPNSSSALQRPLSLPLSPVIAACKQVCSFNVNKGGLPQVRRKDLERTLLLVLSLSCLGLPTSAENNPTLFQIPRLYFHWKLFFADIFFTICACIHFVFLINNKMISKIVVKRESVKVFCSWSHWHQRFPVPCNMSLEPKVPLAWPPRCQARHLFQIRQHWHMSTLLKEMNF